MKQLKVLFIHDGPVYCDSAGQYYEYSYHGLKERYGYFGGKIAFLMRVSPVSDETKGTLLPPEIEVISVPNIKTPAGYFRYRKEAKDIIKQAVEKADILILRGSTCSTIALKYANKYKKTYIYECVGCVWDSLWNHSMLGKIMAPYRFLLTRKQIRNAPFVYYVTDRFLQKRYPTKGKWIGCSNVCIPDTDESVLSARKEKNRNLAKRRVVLGTAAAVDVLYKGQQYVIRSLPRLIALGFDVEYRLAGGNNSKSTYLQTLAQKCGVEDRVHFVGSLSSDEIISFYDTVDIYIQPSKQEGLPRSLIEAMSRGCISLGSSIAGIPELLEPESLFQAGNVSDITRVIAKALTKNPDEASERNFRKAKEYSIDILNQRREQFYDRFLDKYFRGNVSEGK